MRNPREANIRELSGRIEGRVWGIRALKRHKTKEILETGVCRMVCWATIWALGFGE